MQRWIPTLGLAACTALTACGLCNADEERAVTVSAPDSLVVTGDGATRKVEIVTRYTETGAEPASFAFTFNTIEGFDAGEGLALTLSGTDATSDELVVLVLALPVKLDRGDVYEVGSTFTVQAGIPAQSQFWGPRDLQQSDRAEAAFTVARYTFPPPEYTPTFRAVSTTGSIRVTNRQRGWVEMAVDLRLVDADGKVATVTGRVQANSERYTPPCT